MKQKKAILYIRVSTDEQAEKGFSLQHQEDRLRNHCAINGIEVLALFKEDYSAKTFERPEWRKVLDYLKRNKESADYVLFLKWDRFSRNAPEAYNMISILNKHKIEPQAIEQPLDLGVPENKIMLAIYLATPEVENDRRSLNTIAGMRKALKSGQWTVKAPIGYLNRRDENNKPIVISSPMAGLVLQAFELYATGQYPIEIVRKVMNAKGLKITRNPFWTMLRNPFYIGRIVVPAYKDEEGILVKGNHEAIIPVALFNDVQDVLLGRKKIGMPTHQHKQEPLPLRGFLTCCKCGKTLTGSGSKGNGGRYYYYHCFDGCKERYKADLINDTFFSVLRTISGNKQLLKTIKVATTHLHKNSNAVQIKETAKVASEIEVYRKRLEKVERDYMDAEIDASEYRNFKGKILPVIEQLTREQTKLNEANPEEREIMEFGNYFLNNMVGIASIKDLDAKHQIFGSMLPEKLIFENGELRTNIDGGVLPMLFNTSKGFKENKKGELKNFSSPSCCVPQTGIEPVLALLQTGF
jgi:site-specific DNA recombinase